MLCTHANPFILAGRRCDAPILVVYLRTVHSLPGSPVTPVEYRYPNMPPPPQKKRKTSASSPEVSALSLELICHVASYANLGVDALNICLAIGPKNANAIRHVCLRNNMEYLAHRLDQYLDEDIESDQVNVYALEWMAVNTDWRKHCTEKNRKDFAIVLYEKSDIKESDDGEEDDNDGDEDSTDSGWRYKIDALAFFNNPLVAIEFGLVEPLKHLVEEVGIDINSHEWNTYLDAEKANLLVFAARQKILSGFQYLLSREDLNVNGKAATLRDGSSAKNIILYAFEDEMLSLASFEAMASHSSFDVNSPLVRGDQLIFPLQYACESIRQNLDGGSEGDLDKKEEKLMALLNKFKAHPFHRTPHFRYPAIAVARLYCDEDPRMDRIHQAMMEVLSIDEQDVWIMTPYENFD